MPLPQIDNTNLAYDLSRFDTSIRKQQEEEQEEKEHQHKILLAERSVSKSGSRLLIVAVCALFFAAFFAVNYFNTERYEMARAVTKQQQALENAQDYNVLLQSKLDAQVNINYIDEYAANVLGMEKVSSSQKKYISVKHEKLIEVDPDENDGFIGSIKKWFGDIVEYIGL